MVTLRSSNQKPDDEWVLHGGFIPYEHSPISKDQIRVLTLQPAARLDDPFVCDLPTVKLADHPAYDALSYAWDDPTPVSSIQIEGRHLRIASNLDSALRRMRTADSTVTLWVDAISMNMANFAERNHQILKMRSIFKNADKVIAWLGEETADSRGAFEFLEKAVEAPDTDDVLCGNATATYWDRVRALLRRSYFSRVWIVQEIAIARQVTLLHGDTSMDWETFEAAVAIFQKRLELYPDEVVAEERHRLVAATRFVHVLHRCFIRDELGNVIAPAMSP
jgi:hypothetical protein